MIIGMVIEIIKIAIKFMKNIEIWCNSKESKIDAEFNKKLNTLTVYVQDVYKKSVKENEQKEKKPEKFNKHNEDILCYAEILAKEEKVNERDLKDLKLAAVLRDVAKFDSPLVKHGFDGAKIAEEKLKEMGFRQDTVEKVKHAIERHMGPIPGFMEKEAKKWEEKTGEKIEFPRPKNIVDQLLYDADMLSLIDQKGIEKILAIRKNVDIFKNEDEKTAKKEGISIEAAAWQSALKSGKEAADSLFTKSAKRQAETLLKSAQELMEKSLGK